jgi:hypothetical protein
MSLLTFQFSATPILIPLDKLQQYKQRGSLILSATGFIAGWLFLKVIIDSSDYFRSTDLIVTGGLVSTCYLLRRLGPPSSGLNIIKALREIRRDLALGDVDGQTAKRRYVAVVSGMTLAEALDDYTRPVSLLLRKALEEMTTARGILASLREAVEGNVQTAASLAPEQNLAEQWEAQREHYKGALRLFAALGQLGRARRFRLLNRLMHYYRRRYFPVLTGQSRAEVEVVLAGLEELHRDYLRAEREYLAERERATAAVAKRLDTLATETGITSVTPDSFDLPSWLQTMRTSLLAAR